MLIDPLDEALREGPRNVLRKITEKIRKKRESFQMFHDYSDDSSANERNSIVQEAVECALREIEDAIDAAAEEIKPDQDEDEY